MAKTRSQLRYFGLWPDGSAPAHHPAEIIRPVLSGAAPAIASVFQDAVVIDAFVAAAAVLSQPLPPLPSSPPAKLRAV
jgi:hypothetical protein